MLFIDFVKYLEKLEKISSRLEITRVLADLIAKMSGGEADKGVYLTLGMLGPDFDNPQFQMAVKMIIRAISEGTGEPTEVVVKRYKQKGDLGILVEEMKFAVEKKSQHSVGDVFEKLKAIAMESGSGSQERKVVSLKELLLSVTPAERKFVVRMVMGKLRLGFSAKTIFDALSQMESGNKDLRKELDRVFQIFPDCGYISKVVKEKGVSGLSRVRVKTGVPVVPALCQRLNSYEEIIKKMDDVAVERKFDGTRVQIHFERKADKVYTYTRNLEESSDQFPELRQMKEWVKADQLILDCEAVGYDTKTGKILPFQVTITRKRKHGVEEMAKSVPMKFFVFDILNLDGESLLDKPYFERRKILSEVIRGNKVLAVDEFVHTSSAEEVKSLHDSYLKEGFEGAVIKLWNGTYLPGRQGWNWVKIKEAEGTTGKLADTFDLVILGYYFGRGKRTSFGIGAFLVGLLKEGNWISLAKIGTGLSDEEFKDLRVKLDEIKEKEKPENYKVSGSLIPDVWVAPKIVVEVAADEITTSPSHAGGVALRFPRLVKFRADKKADQATNWKEFVQIMKISEVK